MARRSVADFLSSFVLPLVAGGEVRVGRPLAATDVQEFEKELPDASVELVAVDEARAEVLSALVVRPPALVLDADELYLAAALHNVLFLIHPDAAGVLATRRARARLVETTRRMAAQPLTHGRRRVLARHGLLHNVFAITRTDIKVSWWTGSASYYGQVPPGRLTLWRSVRRVHEDATTATYADLLCSAEASPVMATLLRRSPLTHIITTLPQAPPLHWEDAVFVLRDDELARAVAYEALRPADPGMQLVAPARHAAAFEQMLERAPASADVRAVAAFLVHLNALLALSEARLRDHASPSPLLTMALASERAGQRPRGLTTFLALPNALARIDPVLAVPPGVAAEPRLGERWRVHREQVAAGVGEAVIDTLVVRLARHLGAAGALPPGPVNALPALPPAPAELPPAPSDASETEPAAESEPAQQ